MVSASIYVRVKRMHLLGINEGCVPLSHACADKSSTSEYMMSSILGPREGSQQRFRLCELIAFPCIKRSVLDMNVWLLGYEAQMRKGNLFVRGRTLMRKRYLMMIFLPETIASWSSWENAIERFSMLRKMRPSWVCVDVSVNRRSPRHRTR